MKPTILLFAGLLAATAPIAMAQGNGNGNGPPAHAGNGAGNRNASAPGPNSDCPPGLAKKNPPCVPPGQAKAAPTPDDDSVVYEPGEIVSADYILVEDPAYYGLDPYYSYYRVGDRFYRVNEDTQEVIAFVGALADLLD